MIKKIPAPYKWSPYPYTARMASSPSLRSASDLPLSELTSLRSCFNSGGVNPYHRLRERIGPMANFPQRPMPLSTLAFQHLAKVARLASLARHCRYAPTSTASLVGESYAFAIASVLELYRHPHKWARLELLMDWPIPQAYLILLMRPIHAYWPSTKA